MAAITNPDCRANLILRAFTSFAYTMSSRALRRLQKKQELEALEGSDESDPEITTAPQQNLFDLVLGLVNSLQQPLFSNTCRS